MPGSILPLPVMLEEERGQAPDVQPPAERPRSVVVRYGYMKLIAELPCDPDMVTGCGSRLVIRTHRGIELGVMLTTVCANAGCGHSVTRKEMLQYIEASGGKSYPFTNQGRVLRIATAEDLAEQSRLDGQKRQITQFTRSLIREIDLPMKLVDIELLLGGERIVFHYTSDQWVDFRELVRRLAAEYQTRIEMHQVNARDEARLVADYEKCGQHCCCKQFLKVLKPVSMKSAKIQKATLDPSKISGRCGRLMCCLRYEQTTYDDLRKRLPRKQSRMMTDDGPGTVIDGQILTQLALVRLDATGALGAYPIESLRLLSREEEQELREKAEAAAEAERQRLERQARRRAKQAGGTGDAGGDRSRRRSRDQSSPDQPSQSQGAGDANAQTPTGDAPAEGSTGYRGSGESTAGDSAGPDSKPRRRRRRRRKPRGEGQDAGSGDNASGAAGGSDQNASAGDGEGGGRRRRRRRRRRPRGDNPDGGGQNTPGDGGGGDGGPGGEGG